MKGEKQEQTRTERCDGAALEALFALLRYETCATEIPEAVKDLLAEKETLRALYETSKAHDLAHLIADALLKKRWISKESDVGKAFSKQLQTAVFRYEQIHYELESVCAVLEEAKIPYMPLKGSVLRALYPEPWMRTSCDIDIYVQEKDLGAAINVITEKLGYENVREMTHDVDMYAPSGVHLELHYDLIEEEEYPKLVQALSNVWKNALPTKEGACRYKMTDEDFYFYHIAHTAKHFRNGGCGIRPFIDLWYLEKSLPYNRETAKKMLQECGLLKFSEVARKVVHVWFGGGEHDELSTQTAEYVLTGGVYGVFEQTVAVQVSKGRFSYFLFRVFPPYREMTKKYPSLKKCPILYPFYIVRRWFNLLFVKGRAKNSVREWNTAMQKSKENHVEILLKNLDLHERDIKRK